MWCVPRVLRNGRVVSHMLPLGNGPFLRGKNLSAAFAAADLFVMPSDSETLGFVVLEARHHDMGAIIMTWHI